MAINTKITAKLFPEIGNVGESAGFVDYTDAEMEMNAYSRTVKDLEIAGTVVGSAATDDAGKALLMAQIETDAQAYLATIFTNGASTYDVNIYVLNVERDLGVSDSIAAGDYTTGKYVPHNDKFAIRLRFDTKETV